MLSLGKQKKWPEALELVTGSKNLSTDPIKEYFAPLDKWLKEKREKEKYPLGWDKETPSKANDIVSSLSLMTAIILVLFNILW